MSCYRNCLLRDGFRVLPQHLRRPNPHVSGLAYLFRVRLLVRLLLLLPCRSMTARCRMLPNARASTCKRVLRYVDRGRICADRVGRSEDGTTIIWDLTRLRFTRQIGPQFGAVAAVAISPLTGHIASCARDVITVTTVNGRILAASKLQSGPVITAVAFSPVAEWSNQATIATGHSNGKIKLWQLQCIGKVPGAASEDATGSSAMHEIVVCGQLATQTHIVSPSSVTAVKFHADATR